MVKNLLALQEIFLDQEYPLEREWKHTPVFLPEPTRLSLPAPEQKSGSPGTPSPTPVFPFSKEAVAPKTGSATPQRT